ncbi:MAG: DUF5683 domain-containing protein [bacterium]
MVRILYFISFSLLTFIIFTQANALIASTPSANLPAQKLLLQSSQAKFQFKHQTLNAAFEKMQPQKLFHEVSNHSEAKFPQAVNEKSKGRAFLQSLIIPGWGQHYAESRTMFKVFLASEVLLWGTFLGFTTWSNWLEDDYQTFAVTHAGINLEGKPKQYFVDIGNFDDIFEYNQAQLRDRDVNDLYRESEEFFWRWDSEENRLKFEDMRIRSDRAANRADLTLAAIFTNHLISAIHATLSVHKFNKRLAKPGLDLRIDFDGYSENRHFKVEVVKRF